MRPLLFKLVKNIALKLQLLWSITGILLVIFFSLHLASVLFHHGSQQPYWTNKEFLAIPYRWQPHVYWRMSPFKGKLFTVNDDGTRLTWNSNVPSSKRTRIFMFGGSSLWGIGASNTRTIPSIVSRLLSQAGLNAEVKNFAQPGYENTQELVALLLELQQNHLPDIAVFYDGFNDIHDALWNKSAGESSLEFARRMTFSNLPYGKEKNLKKLMSYFQAPEPEANKVFTPFPYVPGKFEHVNAEKTEKLAHEVLNVYLSNIKLINQLGGENHFKGVFYWQPFLFSKHSKTLQEKDWNNTFSQADFYGEVLNLIDHSNELKREKNFHDLAHVFDNNPKQVYLDCCSLTPSGNEIIAGRIAADLIHLASKAR